MNLEAGKTEETQAQPRIIPSKRVSMAEMAAMAKRSESILTEVRFRTLQPTMLKSTPKFTQTELAQILGKSVNWLDYKLRQGVEPQPVMDGRKLKFTLEQVQQWARAFRPQFMRPAGQPGLVVAIGNFKGGSTKTTTNITEAQGLSILGQRVLVVDADAQASSSNLLGVLPEVDDVKTILPAIIPDPVTGELADIRTLIRKTYWPGVDLIAANDSLSLAEAELPNIENYWESLRKALEPVLYDYDVILIDTSPQLSPLTATCFMAADGLIVPVTPNALDFASSSRFFRMFADIFSSFEHFGIPAKEFEFVKVLLSRVDAQDPSTDTVREFMDLSYTGHVLKEEIPKTTVTTSASVAFGTVFDTQVNRSSRAAYTRARTAYEQLVIAVEKLLCAAWARRVQESEE